VVTLLDFLPEKVSDGVRLWRLRRELARSLAAVRRSAEMGTLEPDVAERLVERMSELLCEMRRTSEG
jgi:hypothetical protein